MADTSALVADVKKSVRTGRASPLLMAMRMGVVRIYVAHNVWAEMPRVIATLAATGKLSEEEAAVAEQLWWSRYVPLIRVVDAGLLPADAVSPVLTRRDPTDVPTARLAGLLAPVVVLAADRDLVDVGLADEQWRPVADAGARVAQLAGTAKGGATLVVAAGYGLMTGIRATARLMARPNAPMVAAIVAVGLAASSSWWLPTVRRLRGGFHEHSRALTTAVLDWAEHAGRQLESAYTSWDAAERGTAGQTLIHRAAHVLARAEAPMSAEEIASRLCPLVVSGAQHQQYQSRIDTALRRCSAFLEVAADAWQLGRASADFGVTFLPYSGTDRRELLWGHGQPIRESGRVL